MQDFTHFNEQGRAKMVDISDKETTTRVAVAESKIAMKPEILERILQGQIEKGDVLGVAQIAGVMAAKNTSQWIPMCHPLALTGVNITFEHEHAQEENKQSTIKIQATVKTKGQTGVEMEALTAVSAAALTIYDMCKALDKGMVIGPTLLRKKTGGKSGDYEL